MSALSQYIEQYFAVPSTDSDRIESLFITKQLNKGDYFTEVGKRCPGLAFVTKGCLRVHNLMDGKEITQWIISEGEAATDLSGLVFETPCRWNIQALEDCELYFISTANYQTIQLHLDSWPELEKLFIAKCFLTLEDRVNAFIALNSEQRYQQLFEYKRELLNRVPHHYIASMLGMTPETMSRIRKKFIS